MGNSNITKEIDLKMEKPSIESALRKLRIELLMLRRIGVRKVKVVHGVGAMGDGTSVRNAVRAELREQARDEKIEAFCPGELFGPFETQGRFILDKEETLRDDPDWARSNTDITLVVL